MPAHVQTQANVCLDNNNSTPKTTFYNLKQMFKKFSLIKAQVVSRDFLTTVTSDLFTWNMQHSCMTMPLIFSAI